MQFFLIWWYSQTIGIITCIRFCIGMIQVLNMLLTYRSLYWMSRTQTALQTARQRSCIKKISESMRNVCPPLWNRAGVTVDPLHNIWTIVSLCQPEENHLAKNKIKHIMFCIILQILSRIVCSVAVARLECCCVVVSLFI